MKKIIALFAIITLFSCSSSDDNNSQKSDLNPPSWIQGTWKGIDEDNDIDTGSGYKFTTNDFFLISSSLETSQQGLINQLRKGSTVSVDEKITSTLYTVKLNISTGQAITYSFTKISNTQIEWMEPSGVVFTKR